MKLLVCGSRHFLWTDLKRVDEVLDAHLPRPTLIISGLATGPDTAAILWADKNGVEKMCMAPDWARYGKSAGRRRNEAMLDEGKPDKVLAFWDGRSRGTKHMIEIARKAGIPVEIVVMPREKQ